MNAEDAWERQGDCLVPKTEESKPPVAAATVRGILHLTGPGAHRGIFLLKDWEKYEYMDINLPSVMQGKKVVVTVQLLDE